MKLSFCHSNILIIKASLVSLVALWPRWKLSLFPSGGQFVTQLPYKQQHLLFLFQSSCPSWNVHQVPVSGWAKQRWLLPSDHHKFPNPVLPVESFIPQASLGHSDLLKACYTSSLIISMWLYGCTQRNDDKSTSTEIGRALFPNLLICKEKAKLYSHDGGYALGIQKTPVLRLLQSRRCRSDSLSGGWQWRVRWLENMYFARTH